MMGQPVRGERRVAEPRGLLPGWLPLFLAVVLLGAAVVVAWWTNQQGAERYVTQCPHCRKAVWCEGGE